MQEPVILAPSFSARKIKLDLPPKFSSLGKLML